MFSVPAFRRAVCAVTLLSTAAISAAPIALAQSKKEPSYYGAQPATENIDLNMYAQIRAEGLGHSHVMEYMSGLSDGIGPRLTGSPNMKKANEWTRDRMTDAGLVNAHLEDWGEFGMGWAQVNSWARMITPDTEPIWIQAAPWSAATKGAVSADAVLVELTTEADLQKFKGKLAGKIVLLGAPHAMVDITEPLFSRYTEAELKEMEGPEPPRGGRAGAPNIQQLLAERARLTALRTAALKMMTEEGVAAIISPSRDGGKGGGSGIIFDDNGANLVRGAQTRASAVVVPNAVTTVEMYGRMYRLLKANAPVKLEVNIETTFTGDHEHGFNTVAEIAGTDPKLKNEVVMVGGHLDSWIAGTGATDNGAGSVVAMEAMRILKSIGYKPKRTLRIALWSGEEQGLFGSRGYVKQHFGQVRREATIPNGRSHARVHARWRTRSVEAHQGVGDAGRLLQPGQWQRASVRGVYTPAELRHWADLCAMDCAAERSGRDDGHHAQHGRNRSPFL